MIAPLRTSRGVTALAAAGCWWVATIAAAPLARGDAPASDGAASPAVASELRTLPAVSDALLGAEPAAAGELDLAPPDESCLADAALTPTPALGSALCAGYDKGFYVATADRAYLLQLNVLLQPRYIANWRDLPPAAGDDGEAGFTLARAPLLFSGHVWTPQLTYWLVLQEGQSTGAEFTEEARINYLCDNGLYFQLGRFRDPTFMRELDVSYAKIMGVERSYQQFIFSTGIEEGLCVSRQTEVLRTMAFLNDGRNSGGAASTKDFYEDATDFAISAGGDIKLAGEWAQYDDFASWPEQPLGVFLGADIHYESPETGDSLPVNDQNEFFAWTVDATVERHGLALFGSFVARESLVAGENIDQTGVQALAAYQVVPEKLEPFVRYEYIDFGGWTNVGANRTPVADSVVNMLSLGGNWYFHRNSLKLTTEAMYAFDPVPVAAPLTGWLVDAPGRAGQFVLRTQLQLFF